MKKLINNKWHLHTGLCIIALILFMHFITKYPKGLEIEKTVNITGTGNTIHDY